ncbi:MAG TPA: DUF1080 domain-containing protein [Chryseolinea sp.]
MKSIKKLYVLLLLLALCLPAIAQDQRLLKTKVADVLALLPATDNEQGKRLYHELLNLGDEGMVMVMNGVVPNGNAAGTSSRYAVSLLTHYATSAEDKSKIEHTYLVALSKATDPEVKAYFISNLKLVGSNESVKPLATYIADKDLFDPAVSALVSINTADAKQVLVSNLNSQNPEVQVKLTKALGRFSYQPALESITKNASSDNLLLKKASLWSLALIADPGSLNILLQQATNIGFKNDPSEATNALVEYMHQVSAKGNTALVKEISKPILEKTTDPAQQHYRLAAIKELSKVDPKGSLKLLVQERSKFDGEYQKEILKIASRSANTPDAIKRWQKELKKATGGSQADIFTMLVSSNPNDPSIETLLTQSISSENPQVRMAAANEMARRRNAKYLPAVLDYLVKSTDDAEIAVATDAVLRLADKNAAGAIASRTNTAAPKSRAALIKILAARRDTEHFDVVAKEISSTDALVKSAALEGLPNVSANKNVSDLLNMLATSQNDNEIKAIQSALIASIDNSSVSLVNDAYAKDKIKVLPVLPYLNDKSALEKVVSTFYHGNEKEKEVAFEALRNWQDQAAARTLLAIRKDPALKKYHETALSSFISQVGKSTLPDDQKLLMLRESMPLAADKKEKSMVLRAAGSIRTFLSLMFVSRYIDDPDASAAASRSAMQIALPTADAKPGLTGIEVRNTLQRMLDKLTGDDSQYERIDILTYLESLPYTKGFEPIFNGKDFTGWQGLVGDPIARSKMTKEVLAKKQLEANAKVSNNWSVKDGNIVFQGDGANLCTTRKYGDFEMVVDWKISKNGDSGIYLRGSPQVQIWDVSRVNDGAQVGSGGLYNNEKERSTPLVVADNPVGEWNTFHIKMIGDRVTVYLNGVLVVDNVAMENYWDRKLPIFSEEAIELQAHGTELAFRDIYVKELSSKAYELTKEEKEQGFEVLFNGKDLNNWVGNKTDYVVEDNTIAIYPTKEGHGNLNSEKEYSDFIFRFEFQLTPGANNGLGIHAPLDGDAAYAGKEIQILDNTAPVYSKLEVWQYHGSVYGILPAKREFLKPVGEWNREEVYVKGDIIKVTLNGTVIAEGDLKKATKNGTLDHKDHPGLTRHSGHIGFLGHGTVVKFRNIRIKDLAK